MKLALRLFADSSFIHSINLLRTFPMKLELWTSFYKRYWHAVENVVNESGICAIPTETDRDSAEAENNPDAGLPAVRSAGRS